MCVPVNNNFLVLGQRIISKPIGALLLSLRLPIHVECEESTNDQ
jgi:hypothetical protein